MKGKEITEKSDPKIQWIGLELCPLIGSLQSNEEYFVALLIAGIALAVPDMAWAFGIGIAVDLFIRRMKTKI